MTLRWKSNHDFSYLASPEWDASGIRHGFIGAAADFSKASVIEWKPRFLDAFSAAALFLPAQIHGNKVADLRDGNLPDKEIEFAECDAVIAPCKGFTKERIAIGIRTADCLPILIFDGESIALIHAGWRGLACGVIQETIRVMNNPRAITAIIGPAAGKDRYEVGREVFDAIGEKAVSARENFLDLAGTAREILETSNPGCSIEAADFCTISDERFHSFRREGAPPKSNLAFVIV